MQEKEEGAGANNNDDLVKRIDIINQDINELKV
jgi:hypothetical protein